MKRRAKKAKSVKGQRRGAEIWLTTKPGGGYTIASVKRIAVTEKEFDELAGTFCSMANANSMLPCLCCLAESSVELRQDRKARPFTRCVACGCVTFMPTPRSLAGLSYLAPILVNALVRQFGSVAAGQAAVNEQVGADPVLGRYAHG